MAPAGVPTADLVQSVLCTYSSVLSSHKGHLSDEWRCLSTDILRARAQEAAQANVFERTSDQLRRPDSSSRRVTTGRVAPNATLRRPADRTIGELWA